MASPSTFPVIRSVLNLRQKQYDDNVASWRPVLEKFEAALAAASSEGTAQSLDRHVKRGQLLGMSDTANKGALES